MDRHLTGEVENIKRRFRKLGDGLYEYTIKDHNINIKEILIIEVLLDKNKEGIVVRVTPVIYSNKDNELGVFHLLISEISPQFDLKNSLINLLFDTLEEFKEKIVNPLIEQPGIYDYLILRLLFLLDQLRICYLFLKGATGDDKFQDYMLDNIDKERNAKLVNILSHNIGGFLKDETVTSFFKEMGRERVLEKWYGWLAEAKLHFLCKTPYLRKNRKEDIDLLRKWFAQRYDVLNYWQCLEPKWFAYIILVIAIVVVFCFVTASQLCPRLLCVAFSNEKGTLSVAHWGLIGFLISWIASGIIHKNPIHIFEILIPRLFLGVLIGSVSLLGFESSLWKAALENKVHWTFLSIAVMALIFAYMYSRIREDKISTGCRKRVFLILRLIIWISFLSVFSVTLLTLSVGKGFIDKLESGYSICPQLLLFWIIFSMFVGLFTQLIWQERRITEPI